MKIKLVVFTLIILACGGFWYYKQQPNPTENLYYAIQADDVEKAKHAIARGANVNGEGARPMGPHGILLRDNHTPLQMAVEYPRGELVRLLLESGADPDRTSVDGHNWTNLRPLEAALRSYNSGITQMLLDAKADPNLNIPLAQASRPLEREMLIKAGADPNYIDPGSRAYCLMNYAGAEPKAHPLWQFFIRHGGKPRHITQGDRTPVYFCTFRGKLPQTGWIDFGEVKAKLSR